MCRPDAFDVIYAINAWMDPTVGRRPGTGAGAVGESSARCTRASATASTSSTPLPGQPDMVFAANGGVVVGGRALGARFAHAERRSAAPAFLAWLQAAGWSGARPSPVTFEGEGDVVVCSSVLLVGSGFRTSPAAADVVRETLRVPVLPLRLADPRFYHLDTAVLHLGDDRLAWYPPALDGPSQAALRRRFPDAVEAEEADALALGLNGWSDGTTVVLPVGTTGLGRRLRALGHDVVEVDVSELRRAGGGPKCCTWEMHPALAPAGSPVVRPADHAHPVPALVG